MKTSAAILAVSISANVINGPETLEPSIVNEVEHALSRAPVVSEPMTNAVADVFATNGLSATATAIRLVSLQKADGTWMVNGTNMTQEAVRILRDVSGLN